MPFQKILFFLCTFLNFFPFFSKKRFSQVDSLRKSALIKKIRRQFCFRRFGWENHEAVIG